MDMLVRNVQHGLEFIQLASVQAGKMRIRELLHVEVKLAKPPALGPEQQLATSNFDILAHSFTPISPSIQRNASAFPRASSTGLCV